MLADPGKHSLPVGEAPNVIYGIEYAANHVKPVVDVKIDHVLPKKLGMRHFMPRNREHSAGSIQPRHFVITLQIPQYRPRSTSELKHVYCVWICRPNKLPQMLCCSRAISHYGVVEFPEHLIRGHVVQFTNRGSVDTPRTGRSRKLRPLAPDYPWFVSNPEEAKSVGEISPLHSLTVRSPTPRPTAALSTSASARTLAAAIRSPSLGRCKPCTAGCRRGA